jgi:Peptidase propeptide and YPEB domain
MEAKIFATAGIVTATLLALTGLTTFATAQGVNAQKSMMGEYGDYGNMTSGDKQKMGMINGTINLEQTIFEAIGSKVNTTLTQAITTAEQSVGNNSFALAAFGGDHGGYLAYTILLSTPEMEFYKVIVDPGNGQVLASNEVSHKEWMKMQQMMHSSATGGEGMMMRGPEGMMGHGGMMGHEGMMKSGHGSGGYSQHGGGVGEK